MPALGDKRSSGASRPQSLFRIYDASLFHYGLQIIIIRRTTHRLDSEYIVYTFVYVIEVMETIIVDAKSPRSFWSYIRRLPCLLIIVKPDATTL